MQLSLLVPELPKGMSYLPHFITLEEELLLMAFIQGLIWEDIHMHGVIAKRKVVHFGYGYEYDSRSLLPALPPPDELGFLIKRAARHLHKKKEDLAEVLVTWYPKGAQIGWHRDAPSFESVFGISLGGSCVMKLREGSSVGGRQLTLPLEARSAYVIEGEARWKWQHHIPPVPEDRYSITLRTLRQGNT